MLETILTMIAVIISLYFIYSQLSKLNNRINVLEEEVFKLIQNNNTPQKNNELNNNTDTKSPSNEVMSNNPLFSMLSGGLPDFLNISPPTNSVDETCNLNDDDDNDNDNDDDNDDNDNDNNDDDDDDNDDDDDDNDDDDDDDNDDDNDNDNDDDTTTLESTENITNNIILDSDESNDDSNTETLNNGPKYSKANLEHTLNLISNNLAENESSCLEPYESEDLKNVSQQKRGRGRKKKINMD